MLWICLLVLSICSGGLHGEETDPLADSGIRFRMLEGRDWAQLPLYKGARAEWNLLLEEFPIYTLTFSVPMRAVVENVQGQEGEVRCDCGLFVQVAAQLLSDSTKAAVLLPTVENFPETIACACGSDLAYLRVRDPSAHQTLQSTWLMNKGQWLLPMDDEQYLGLDRDGIRLATEKEWSARIANALRCEIELIHVSEEERKYVQRLIDKGDLSDWSLDRFSSQWPKRHKKDLERILNRVRRQP